MSELFSGILRGVPGMDKRSMSPPHAVYEDPDRVAAAQALRYTPDKIFLGLVNAKIEHDVRTDEIYAQDGVEIGAGDDRHVITVAGSRAGKGRAAVIPNMMRYKGSVLAIDPKGELAIETASVRARAGQQVYVLDPFDTTEGKLEGYYGGFNPVAMMQYGTMVEDAALIADALIVPGGGDPHWDESARTFLEGVILEVFTADRYEWRRDLITARDLIAEGETLKDAETGEPVENSETGETVTGLKALEIYMRASAYSAVRHAAADFFERPERERASVLSTVRRHLRALSFPEIEASLQGEGGPSGSIRELDLNALKTEAVTVYLCLPGRHIGTCGRWLRLFVNLALQAMERTPAFAGADAGVTATGCPVLFVLDEFASLGHMRQIEDAAGQIAGYGVKLWPILQDLGQLKALYKERWETFMGNAGILQFFGNNDLTTLEWISKRVGTTTILQLSSSMVTPKASEAGATGSSYAPHTVAVIEPHEAAIFFGRSDPYLRQLIIRPGVRPMILQRAYHDKHKAFRHLH